MALIKLNNVLTGMDYILEYEKKYPNRRKQIHKQCCKHCPTKVGLEAGLEDPESKSIKQLPKELITKEYLFVCAWRPNKLCKGLCDYMEINEEFINQVK